MAAVAAPVELELPKPNDAEKQPDSASRVSCLMFMRQSHAGQIAYYDMIWPDDHCAQHLAKPSNGGTFKSQTIYGEAPC